MSERKEIEPGWVTNQECLELFNIMKAAINDKKAGDFIDKGLIFVRLLKESGYTLVKEK